MEKFVICELGIGGCITRSGHRRTVGIRSEGSTVCVERCDDEIRVQACLEVFIMREKVFLTPV